MASDYTFYVDPPVDVPPNQRKEWLDRLADALADSDKLEMAVIDAPGGALTWDESAEQIANCKTKVVVVVNGRPCGPKLLDPVQFSKLSKFKKDADVSAGSSAAKRASTRKSASGRKSASTRKTAATKSSAATRRSAATKKSAASRASTKRA